MIYDNLKPAEEERVKDEQAKQVVIRNDGN